MKELDGKKGVFCQSGVVVFLVRVFFVCESSLSHIHTNFLLPEKNFFRCVRTLLDIGRSTGKKGKEKNRTSEEGRKVKRMSIERIPSHLTLSHARFVIFVNFVFFFEFVGVFGIVSTLTLFAWLESLPINPVNADIPVSLIISNITFSSTDVIV